MEQPHDIKPRTTIQHRPLTKVKPPTITAAADSDQTEYSSSFANTDTDTDTDTSSSNSSSTFNHHHLSREQEEEVDSKFHQFSTPFSLPLRKNKNKKLTSHWRSFVRPLMWRCKWAELKLKQFQSQAFKYAKIITSLNQTKHLANQSIPLGFTSRSIPFHSPRRKLMKRRKRVRLEETMDAKIYMSNHILFSYNENSKLDQDGISMTDDDFDDPAVTGHQTSNQEELGFDMHKKWSFFEEKDNENDNDMEQILQKIDTAQNRVHKLKGQLDVVISENVNHLAPFETQTSPTFSALHIPDIIESTEGLPSSVDVDVTLTHHHSQVGDSSENIVDNTVVLNQGAEAEKRTLRNGQEKLPVAVVKQEGDQSEKEEEEEEEEAEEESNSATKDTKSCRDSGFQIPKHKRKRGERKGGTGNWSRQCPAEPADDSQ